MKKIELEEVNNGYWIRITDGTSKELVYGNTSEFQMLEDIGKFLLDYKIKVERR